MNMQSIAESLTCPITGIIMKDPVSATDGRTYERSAITEWLGRNQISPITRQPMYIKDLTTNIALRYILEQYNLDQVSNGIGQMDVDNIGDTLNNNNNNNNNNFDNNNNNNNFDNNNFDNYKLGHSICAQEGNKIMLNIDVPSNLPRLSQDIILIIDRSGSMNEPVTAKNDNGENIESGLSQQDLVNHAANTVIKTLSAGDRIAIIAFDNDCQIVVPFLIMTPLNIASALTKVTQIRPRGQTNIWLPIEEAIKLIDLRDDKSRNAAIILLTDGVPNISPARGEVETFKRHRDKYNVSCQLYTIGFGYSLQRGLLYELAKEGDGNTGHIPDGSMIATVFNNFIGNILCTVAVNIKLVVRLLNGTVFDRVNPLMGDYCYTLSPSNDRQELVANIGSIQLEQSRNIIINLDIINLDNIDIIDANKPFMEYSISYMIGQKVWTSEFVEIKKVDLNISQTDIKSHIIRYSAVEQIRKAINLKTRRLDASQCLSYMKEICVNNPDDKNTENLLETINDQISLALSDSKCSNNRNGDTYFTKWGEFYCDQLSRSLNLQQRCNFKDAAVRNFGGTIFNSIVDHSSDMFDTIPPPVPSLKIRQFNSSSPQRVTTSSYNSQSAPCFTGDCLIVMSNMSVKKIKDLQKGDLVYTSNNYINPSNTFANNFSLVVCILETKFPTKYANIVTLENGLEITEWHPIYYDNQWVYPNSIAKPIYQPCESVFSLVLDTNHIVIINGIRCICLGHDYTNGILRHDYFGSSKVIDDLSIMPGWAEGKIVITAGSLQTDLVTGLINKILYK